MKHLEGHPIIEHAKHVIATADVVKRSGEDLALASHVQESLGHQSMIDNPEEVKRIGEILTQDKPAGMSAMDSPILKKILFPKDK